MKIDTTFFQIVLRIFLINLPILQRLWHDALVMWATVSNKSRKTHLPPLITCPHERKVNHSSNNQVAADDAGVPHSFEEVRCA